MRLGNITPSAEYNFWVDPEAAKLYFIQGFQLPWLVGKCVRNIQLWMMNDHRRHCSISN